MKPEKISFSINKYNSDAELNSSDKELLALAREATELSWSPYSDFRVGAAARLVNGVIVKGANQENAAFPAGICAERVLLSTAASLYPGIGIAVIAISYQNMHGPSEKPISPCGICRQSFYEFQQRTRQPIRMLLGGMSGQVFELENAAHLLPLVFGSDDMK